MVATARAFPISSKAKGKGIKVRGKDPKRQPFGRRTQKGKPPEINLVEEKSEFKSERSRGGENRERGENNKGESP